MASIRITRFAGLLPEFNPKALANDHAQIAHNCLLRDGWLRPLPQWILVQSIGQTIRSIYKDPTQTHGYQLDINFLQAYRNLSEPYNNIAPIGINPAFILEPTLCTLDTNNNMSALGLPIPNISFLEQNISSGNKSVYPISRTYAITYVSGNQEGPPLVLPQLPYGCTLFNGVPYTVGNLIYEGDTVQLIIGGIDFAQISNYRVNGIKLYRTIPGFDTSEQLGNPVETGFHYVSGIFFDPSVGPGEVVFNDGQDSSQIPGDLLISDQWMPPMAGPSTPPVFFGQTEGGWAIVANQNANTSTTYFSVSERYMHHAWPPQNTIQIPEVCNGMAAYYDTVFLGTNSVAYRVLIGVGEGDTLVIDAKPFLNSYACISNTMVATNFGAMYVAKDGIISLTSSGDTVATKRVANPGDLLNTNKTTPFHIYDAQQTAWWDGDFYGFTPNGGYIFNQPNPSNQEFPLSQLVTFDQPPGILGPNVVTGSGLYAVWGSSVYRFPMPGYGYDSNTPAIYIWRSKRYVMPGLTTFAGVKVVGTQNGGSPVFVTIRGYNNGGETSPSFIYSRSLTHSRPWRIPHQFKNLEFEVELEGQAVIQEFHMATNYKDLTEEPNGG